MLENARKTTFMALEHLTPNGRDPMRDVIKTIRKATGYSEHRAKTVVIIGMRLMKRLPQTLALQRALYLLDDTHIAILASVLDAADGDTYAAIDAQLARMLTPTMPRQAFPDYTAFRRRVTRILLDTNPQLAEQENPADPPDFELDQPGQDEAGPASLHAEFTKMDGFILDETLRKIAAQYACTRQEAFHKLIFDQVTVQLTLNIYQAEDIPDAPAWISGIGWITGELREELLAKVTKTRDLADYKDKAAGSYAPSEGIKAYVEGRDGGCGVPGCNVPAHRCQKDHRVEYAEGGETSSKNLLDVCSYDHNHKTNGGLHYILDPETGTTIWLHTDGTFEVSLATGPLSPQGKWEAQTVADYTRERQRRAKHRRKKED
ncbi:HNH endonuclease signature motif containing protein [Corynebacterium renale]|uniref:HNH endonuclease signature motif containing protein n=1 Tax=Corynebacterium renale TaxID=1724 RepID=UPI00128CEACA|nr:HNH endonuclease signature motif containing protein [Corynebacterium renale]